MFSHPVVRGFLGPTQSALLDQVEAGKDGLGKSGEGLKCDSYFRGTCPWDPAGVTSIIMKLMVCTFFLLNFLPHKQELINARLIFKSELL